MNEVKRYERALKDISRASMADAMRLRGIATDALNSVRRLRRKAKGDTMNTSAIKREGR